MPSPSEFELSVWTGRRFDIEDAMYVPYEEEGRDDPPHRHHLGASDIGNICPRHHVYTYRHACAKEFPPRLYKVFDTGHRAEPIIARDLRRIGVEINIETTDGKQFSYTSYGGHVTVNLDGLARIPDALPVTSLTTWKDMIVEMKTMSLKRFKTLTGKGLKSACPEYFRQMQTQLLVAEKCGDHYDGAFFIALCKDTDEYFTLEVDPCKETQELVEKQILLLLNGHMPMPLDSSIKSPPCRFCDYLKICKQDRLDLLEKNCRTCNHAEMVLKSDNDTKTTWRCKLGNEFGTLCSQWGQYIGF